MLSPLTRVRGALQLNTAERSGDEIPPLEPVCVPEESEEPLPPHPVSSAPIANAAIHACDTLMTRFMLFKHHFFVDFVKLYKTGLIIDVNSVIPLVTKLSISRQGLVMKLEKLLIGKAKICPEGADNRRQH
jgi:hypothetical protein